MEKNISIIGITGVSVIIAGFICKLLHIPGAGIGLTLGIILMVIYVTSYTIKKTKSTKGTGKIYTILLAISTALMLMCFLFKLMHWPGVKMIFLTFFIFYSLLVITSFIRVIKEKNKEVQDKYINILIWLITAGILLFTPVFLSLNQK